VVVWELREFEGVKNKKLLIFTTMVPSQSTIVLGTGGDGEVNYPQAVPRPT